MCFVSLYFEYPHIECLLFEYFLVWGLFILPLLSVWFIVEISVSDLYQRNWTRMSLLRVDPPKQWIISIKSNDSYVPGTSWYQVYLVKQMDPMISPGTSMALWTSDPVQKGQCSCVSPWIMKVLPCWGHKAFAWWSHWPHWSNNVFLPYEPQARHNPPSI